MLAPEVECPDQSTKKRRIGSIAIAGGSQKNTKTKKRKGKAKTISETRRDRESFALSRGVFASYFTKRSSTDGGGV